MEAPSEPNTRILLVEDDEDDYVLTKDLLDKIPDYPYSIEWVTDCQKALSTINSAPHDVCLLDNMLGQENGIDLLAAFGDIGAPMPIIMLTGVADRGIDNSAMRAAASDFLVKDQLSPELLERSIRYATERHRLRAELEQLAKYDSLTGLANRRLFQDFLAGAVARTDRGTRSLGLLFLDLDHFKYVNDSFGHTVGDNLLVEVAHRLKECVRTGDLVARLGGDEFAIVLDDIVNIKNALTVAENVFQTLNKPCEIDEHDIQTHASIGIALYSQGFSSPTELIKAADTAMYEAKRNGRNKYRVFSLPMQKAAVETARLDRALAEDVAANRFSIHYQPQIDVHTGMVTGVEALARWDQLQPSEFIPAAERSGLIVELDHKLLRRACVNFGRWRRTGLITDSAHLAVNISAVQLKGNDLLRSVQESLKDSGLPAEVLELELTETAVMEDPHIAVSILDRLDALGVRIVLDDFGTGYSSLAHLNKLPIRALKIDRSFIKDIGIEEQSETIIKATIGLANNLGLDMVAEGVETESQAEFLLQCGCRIMQGWLFSHALPATELKDRLLNGALINTKDFRINVGAKSASAIALRA